MMQYSLAGVALLAILAAHSVSAADQEFKGVAQVVATGDTVIYSCTNSDAIHEMIITNISNRWMSVALDINFIQPKGWKSIAPKGKRLMLILTDRFDRLEGQPFSSPDRMYCLSIAELANAKWVDINLKGNKVES
jgi:hypothetical protein